MRKPRLARAWSRTAPNSWRGMRGASRRSAGSRAFREFMITATARSVPGRPIRRRGQRAVRAAVSGFRTPRRFLPRPNALLELPDHGAEFRLGHGVRGFAGAEPAFLALAALGPILQVLADLEREDLDLARDRQVWLDALRVKVAAERALADLAEDACLLESLALCDRGGLAPLHGPALRDDPALRLARGHEQHLDTARLAEAVGQSPVLAALLRATLLDAVHRQRTSRPPSPERGSESP